MKRLYDVLESINEKKRAAGIFAFFLFFFRFEAAVRIIFLAVVFEIFGFDCGTGDFLFVFQGNTRFRDVKICVLVFVEIQIGFYDNKSFLSFI